MSWTDSYELPYATVVGRFGETSKEVPEVSALNGEITFYPTVPFIKVDGSVIKITPVTAQVREGVIVNPDGGEGVKVPATDIETDHVTNWGWRAQFRIDNIRILPVPFYAPSGEVVDLSGITTKITGLPVEVVTGPKGDPGDSAYDLAVKDGFDGSYEDWAKTLIGPPGPEAGVTLSFPRQGVVRVHDNIRPSRIPWSVNPLAYRADRGIKSLWYDSQSGLIYSGYGDWSANGDEVGVVSHNIAGSAKIEYFPDQGSDQQLHPLNRAGAYTEAIEFFTNIDGSIYVPHTDGAGMWEGCGYITNEGGEWHEVSLPGQAIHVFQMLGTSAGMWACGSAIHPNQSDAGPALWFRPKGGDWVTRYLYPVTGQSPGRYYSMRVEDGRVCVFDRFTDPQVLRFTPVDMDKRDREPNDTYWTTYYTNQVTVDGYTYRGANNGIITKEKANQ